MLTPTLLINIVLYNPDKEKLQALLRVCLDYDRVKILLFDNSSYQQNLDPIYSENVILHKSKENVGVAGAHFYACEMAEKEGFDFVLFLDQDSQLPENFITRMITGFYFLQKLYPRLCAVGPCWQDPRINHWYQEKKSKK